MQVYEISYSKALRRMVVWDLDVHNGEVVREFTTRPGRSNYILGKDKPNFPVPAIKVDVAVVPNDSRLSFHNTVTWFEQREFCYDCGGPHVTLVGIVDFDADRSTAFWLTPNVYHNKREIDEGVELYKLEQSLLSSARHDS